MYEEFYKAFMYTISVTPEWRSISWFGKKHRAKKFGV